VAMNRFTAFSLAQSSSFSGLFYDAVRKAQEISYAPGHEQHP
jgi:hypothetical protein